MEYNRYIANLLSLRHELDCRIDKEVEETMRSRGDSAKLKNSLIYTLEDANVLDSLYMEDETSKTVIEEKKKPSKFELLQKRERKLQLDKYDFIKN